VFHPRDGALHPGRWVRRLAIRAAEAGVEICQRSRVESLDELEGERVVVATDGYPSGLLGELEGLIVPTRGQMLATEPLPDRLSSTAPITGVTASTTGSSSRTIVWSPAVFAMPTSRASSRR